MQKSNKESHTLYSLTFIRLIGKRALITHFLPTLYSFTHLYSNRTQHSHFPSARQRSPSPRNQPHSHYWHHLLVLASGGMRGSGRRMRSGVLGWGWCGRLWGWGFGTLSAVVVIWRIGAVGVVGILSIVWRRWTCWSASLIGWISWISVGSARGISRSRLMIDDSTAPSLRSSTSSDYSDCWWLIGLTCGVSFVVGRGCCYWGVGVGVDIGIGIERYCCCYYYYC